MPLLELELLELPFALDSRSSMSVELPELPDAPAPLGPPGGAPGGHPPGPPVSDHRHRQGHWRTRSRKYSVIRSLDCWSGRRFAPAAKSGC